MEVPQKWIVCEGMMTGGATIYGHGWSPGHLFHEDWSRFNPMWIVIGYLFGGWATSLKQYESKLGFCQYLEVSWNRGTPSHHPFLDGISPYKPSSYGGTRPFRKPADGKIKHVPNHQILYYTDLYGSWLTDKQSLKPPAKTVVPAPNFDGSSKKMTKRSVVFWPSVLTHHRDKLQATSPRWSAFARESLTSLAPSKIAIMVDLIQVSQHQN